MCVTDVDGHEVMCFAASLSEAGHTDLAIASVNNLESAWCRSDWSFGSVHGITFHKVILHANRGIHAD